MAASDDGAEAASTNETAATPSRLSKLLGLSPSKGAAGRVSQSNDPSNGMTNGTMQDSTDAAGADAGDSSVLVEPPTPATRGRGASYTATPTKSRSSTYLSNILAAPHASPSSSSSGQADANQGSLAAKLARTASKDASSTSTWRLPSWSSPSKNANSNGLFAPPLPEPPLSASSEASVGLIMGPRKVEPGESPVSDVSGSLSSARANGSDVVDEGISLSDTTGRVDYLTSLPLELSLYVLMFADAATVCQAMQVSKNWQVICNDPTLWREKFYQNAGWHIRPEFFEEARRKASNREDSDGIGRYQTPTRPRRSTTVVSEGSIASRLGRKLGEIVNEMGYLTFYGRASAEKPAREANMPVRTTATAAEAAHAVPAPATQPRSRSNTAASNTSYFASPSRHTGLGRQHTAPASVFSGTAARSRNATITSQHGLDGEEGDQSSLMPGGIGDTSVSQRSGRQRSHSGKALSAFQVSSPTFENKDDAVLALDWKGLYRDRLQLERRWADGNFAKRTMKSHTDSVYCVTLSGDQLISGSRDHSIKVWNAHTGDLLRTIKAHKASVLAIQYDGKLAVTGSSDGALFVWNVDDWSVKTTLTGHTAGVLDVQMNENWIASCSKDTSVRIWRRDTEEPYRVLQGHRGPVNAIQLWKDTIVSASGDSLAKLWDIETGQVTRVFKGHTRGLACIQYNGEVLMTGSNDKSIRVWDPNSGGCLKVLKGHKDLVRTLAFDPIRKRLFSGSYDKTTCLWDLESGNLTMTFGTSHESLVFDVGLDVSRLVSCSHDRKIVLIDFGEDLEAHRFM